MRWRYDYFNGGVWTSTRTTDSRGVAAQLRRYRDEWEHVSPAQWRDGDEACVAIVMVRRSEATIRPRLSRWVMVG